MKIRIKFAKYGSLKFIGHLDMMRFFQKAVRRAQIDIKYSEGFSPHQIMSFAYPLGVGIESVGDYMDIELCSQAEPESIRESLNRCLVEGVRVLAVSVLDENVKNAMASVAAASYLIHEKEDHGTMAKLKGVVEEFYAQPSIPYTKVTKKNVVELDLKEGIYQIGLTEIPVFREISSYAAAMLEENIPSEELCRTTALSLKVDASSSGNIKPSMVLEKLFQYAGIPYEPSKYQVTRTETYTRMAGADSAQALIPLGQTSLS